MKAGPTLTIIILITCCMPACRKDDAAHITSTVNPVKDTSAIVVVTYPYTDTFIGEYYDYVSYDDYLGNTTGDVTPIPDFIFYVIHPNKDRMVFVSGTALGRPKSVSDTFAVNDSNIYQVPNPVWSPDMGYGQMQGDRFTLPTGYGLTFEWSYSVNYGGPDLIIHNCEFSGSNSLIVSAPRLPFTF